MSTDNDDTMVKCPFSDFSKYFSKRVVIFFFLVDILSPQSDKWKTIIIYIYLNEQIIRHEMKWLSRLPCYCMCHYYRCRAEITNRTPENNNYINFEVFVVQHLLRACRVMQSSSFFFNDQTIQMSSINTLR